MSQLQPWQQSLTCQTLAPSLKLKQWTCLCLNVMVGPALPMQFDEGPRPQLQPWQQGLTETSNSGTIAKAEAVDLSLLKLHDGHQNH